MMYTLKKRHNKAQLGGLCMDTQWWIASLNMSISKKRIWVRRPIVYTHTDASNPAGGAFSQGDWLYRPVDEPGFESTHIDLKELKWKGRQ